MYLYRAIDSNGDTVEFWSSERRNLTAAKRFLCKALKRHGRSGSGRANISRMYLTRRFEFDGCLFLIVSWFCGRRCPRIERRDLGLIASSRDERLAKPAWGKCAQDARAHRRVDRQGWFCYSHGARVTPERRAGCEVATLPRSLGSSHLIGGTRAPLR
jgi:hypothetical protein